MPNLDIVPPTVAQIYPKPASGAVSAKSSFVFRVADRGASKLDVATLRVSLGAVNLVVAGALVPGVGWDASKILPWEDGNSPTVVEVVLKASALHAYNSTLLFVVHASDHAGNATARSFTFVVGPSKEYDGSDDNAVLSGLELAMLESFGHQEAEAFRKRVLYGLVPGAVPGTDALRQAVRRAVQLIFRYRQEPIVVRMFPDENAYAGIAMPNARSCDELRALQGQFAEAIRQVLYSTSRLVDQAFLGHVQELATTNASAAALVLLSVLCTVRDRAGTLNG